MWPIILSNRLPIVALVGRYPANKLMGRGLIPARKLASRGLLSPHCKTRAYPVLSTVSSRYSSCRGRLSTRYSPVRHSTRGRSPFRVRLACVKHAASVQSEPESNSPVQICSRSLLGRNQNLKVVLFPFALRLSMNQADLRPSPFLAALGFMRLFRGAVNNFFSELRKNFLEKLFSARLQQPAKVETMPVALACQQLFFFSPKKSALLPNEAGAAGQKPGDNVPVCGRMRPGAVWVAMCRRCRRMSPGCRQVQPCAAGRGTAGASLSGQQKGRPKAPLP